MVGGVEDDAGEVLVAADAVGAELAVGVGDLWVVEVGLEVGDGVRERERGEDAVAGEDFAEVAVIAVGSDASKKKLRLSFLARLARESMTSRVDQASWAVWLMGSARRWMRVPLR